MSYKQLFWVWLTACWLSVMGKRDMLMAASVLQPSLSLSLLKDIYKEHPVSLSLPPLSPEMPYWVNCIIPHIPRSIRSFPPNFALFFTYKHSHIAKSHAIPQGRGRVFDLFREKAHLKDREEKFTQSSVRGRKIKFDWGLSQRHTCVLTARVTGWLNNAKTS